LSSIGGILAIAYLYPYNGSFYGEIHSVHPDFVQEWLSVLLSQSGFKNIDFKE
jgi:hypothetical protein